MIDKGIALVLLDGDEHAHKIPTAVVVRRWMPRPLLPSSSSLAHYLALAISFHRCVAKGKRAEKNISSLLSDLTGF